jgi:hypothetical protein
MTTWKQTRIGSSELQAGPMLLSTTNQSDRGCGWCWHVHADEYGDQTACGGSLQTEAKPRAPRRSSLATIARRCWAP